MMIFHGGHITDRFAFHDHLAAAVAGRLEQYGIHTDIGLDSRSLGLGCLGPSHFQAFPGYEGIEGHILGFKGRCFPPVLFHDPEKGTAEDALSDGRGCSLDHQAFTVHAVFPPVR